MNRLLISAAIPIMALLGWVGKQEYDLRLGFHVRLRIQGYDPRDLLTGHFVRYSLKLDDDFKPCGAGEVADAETCVCIFGEDKSPYFKLSSVSECGAALQNCGLYLKGRCEYSRFLTGVERFSIPEELAPALDTIPEDSSAILAVRQDGSADVVDLLVGEESITQYAKKRLKSAPATPTP